VEIYAIGPIFLYCALCACTYRMHWINSMFLLFWLVSYCIKCHYPTLKHLAHLFCEQCFLARSNKWNDMKLAEKVLNWFQNSSIADLEKLNCEHSQSRWQSVTTAKRCKKLVIQRLRIKLAKRKIKNQFADSWWSAGNKIRCSIQSLNLHFHS